MAAAAAAAAPALEAPAVDYKHSLLASREDYDKMYKRSIEDPAAFWGDIAKGYHWESQVDISCRISQGLMQLLCLLQHCPSAFLAVQPLRDSFTLCAHIFAQDATKICQPPFLHDFKQCQ